MRYLTVVSASLRIRNQYPDVVALVGTIFEANADLTSFVMDSEIVAVDPVDGSIKTFQELSNRARKDVRLEDIKITVCVYAFDLMLHNGNVSLLFFEWVPNAHVTTFRVFLKGRSAFADSVCGQIFHL